jgi:hypothetical protein
LKTQDTKTLLLLVVEIEDRRGTFFFKQPASVEGKIKRMKNVDLVHF